MSSVVTNTRSTSDGTRNVTRRSTRGRRVASARRGGDHGEHRPERRVRRGAPDAERDERQAHGAGDAHGTRAEPRGSGEQRDPEYERERLGGSEHEEQHGNESDGDRRKTGAGRRAQGRPPPFGAIQTFRSGMEILEVPSRRAVLELELLWKPRTGSRTKPTFT